MSLHYYGGGFLDTAKVSQKVPGSKAPIIVRVQARLGLFRSDLGVGHEDAYRGVMLVPTWENQLVKTLKKQRKDITYTPDLLVFHVLEDVFEAYRQQWEILWIYGAGYEDGETGRLMKALEAVKELNLICLGLKKVTNREAIEVELASRVERALNSIGVRVRDDRKVEALNFLEHLGTLLDSRSRPNPTVKAAKTVAAARRLGDRLEVVDTIQPIIVYRREVLGNFMKLLNFQFDGMLHFLDRLLSSDVFPKLDSDQFVRNQVIARLGQFSLELERVDVKPFVLTARFLRQEFDSAQEALEQQKDGLALKVLHRSRESLKLRRIRLAIEKLLTDVAQLVIKKPAVIQGNDRERFLEETKRLRTELENVDETGFKLPVAKGSMLHLDIAASTLLGSTFGLTELKTVKQVLKQAALPL